RRGWMRPAVQRHDARVVNHLVENDDVIRKLHHLHVVVVRPWHQRRTGVEEQTSLREQTIFGTVRRVLAARVSPVRGALLSLGRQRGNSAVGRIEYQRRPFRTFDRGDMSEIGRASCRKEWRYG